MPPHASKKRYPGINRLNFGKTNICHLIIHTFKFLTRSYQYTNPISRCTNLAKILSFYRLLLVFLKFERDSPACQPGFLISFIFFKVVALRPNYLLFLFPYLCVFNVLILNSFLRVSLSDSFSIWAIRFLFLNTAYHSFSEPFSVCHLIHWIACLRLPFIIQYGGFVICVFLSLCVKPSP